MPPAIVVPPVDVLTPPVHRDSAGPAAVPPLASGPSTRPRSRASDVATAAERHAMEENAFVRKALQMANGTLVDVRRERAAGDEAGESGRGEPLESRDRDEVPADDESPGDD